MLSLCSALGECQTMKTVLEWEEMRPDNRPPKENCLFSDGIQFRVGWWSKTKAELYIPNADGTNGVSDSFTPTCWARLYNLIWESVFGDFES